MQANLDYEHQRDIDYKNLPESIKRLMRIKQHPQRSDEWFAARAKMLTASNLDAVLGRNKYSSREEILFKKCGMSVPFTGNKFTEHGCVYEDPAIAEFCRMYNYKTIDFGLIPHPTVDFLGGSPDGIAFRNGDPNCNPIVLEVKAPYCRKIVPGEIPKQYFNQIIVNMCIAGMDGVFIEWVPNGHLGKDYMMNIVHLKLEDYKDDFNNTTLPILHDFWHNDVLHYRNVGIETHPRHSHWERKCNPKPKKTIDFTNTKPVVSLFTE